MITLRGPTTGVGTTSSTLTVPAGTLTGDFMLIVAEVPNGLVVPTPAGWSLLAGMPVDCTGSRMYAWHKVATAPEASVAFTGITDHITSTMFVFNGVAGVAYTGTSALAVASASVAFPGLAGSTATPGDAVMFFTTSEVDTGTAQLSSASLPAGVDKPLTGTWVGSHNSASGHGGGVVWAGGISRTGQEDGATATLLNASRQAKMVIALSEVPDPKDYVTNLQVVTVLDPMVFSDIVSNLQFVTVLQELPPPTSNRRRGFMSFTP